MIKHCIFNNCNCKFMKINKSTKLCSCKHAKCWHVKKAKHFGTLSKTEISHIKAKHFGTLSKTEISHIKAKHFGTLSKTRYRI